MPLHGGGKQGQHHFPQYNFATLEGITKPSTSSATAKPGFGQQFATLDHTNHKSGHHHAASNLTRSKEDDVFSNHTLSNYNQL